MFDILNQAMMYLLELCHTLVGSYGLAIILVTVVIRLALWPLNTAQTKSMKMMQEIQPKVKEIQAKYKDNPQKMQEAMMKLYGEHRFNPMAGCLPMIIQLPIFFALYGALSSPDFMVKAGHESFFFIDRLHHTLQSHGGEPLDNSLAIQPEDKFQTGKDLIIKLNNGTEMHKTIGDPNNTLGIRPQPAIPGEPLVFSIGFDLLSLSNDYSKRIVSASIPVMNTNTREIERLELKPSGSWLVEKVQTKLGENHFHLDVFLLILVYGLISLVYQQLMQKKNTSTPADPMQAKMMKLMPILFIGLLFFIPIPAGVMLYLVSTMVLMVVQHLWVMWREKPPEVTSSGKLDAKKAPQPNNPKVIDIKPNS